MEASCIGGGAEFKRMKTASGIKDTFQEVFAARIQAIATNRKMSKDEREHAIIKLKHSFPQHTTSPVWRFKGLLQSQLKLDLAHYVFCRSQSTPRYPC